MSSDTSAERPWWCQDPSCTPLDNTHAHDGPGGSQWCCGLLEAPRVVVSHGVTHTNDMHHCFRSPLRGVVMSEVNENDLYLLARLSMRALRRRGNWEGINLRSLFGAAGEWRIVDERFIEFTSAPTHIETAP